MKMIEKIIALTFLLFVISCNYKDFNSKDSISVEKIIKDEIFEEGSGIHYLALKFNKNDGLFEFVYSSEGWDWQTKGKYYIKDNIVKLEAFPCPESSGYKNNECSNAFNNGVCSIKPSIHSIEYQFILECLSDKKFIIFTSDSDPSNEITFDIKKYPIPKGSKKKFEGFDIITLENISAKVKEPVVLREGPGINYPKLDYVVNVYDGPIYSSIPKGETVTVHARTAEKQKVKSWENYWLLISIADTRKVWAYAEFFDY